MLNTYDIWAKTEPRQSLIEHSIVAGIVTEVLLNESNLQNVKEVLEDNLYLSSEQVVKFCSYIVSLHDIGKCHPFFQEKDKETEKKIREEKLTQSYSYHFRHEKESERVLKIHLQNKGLEQDIVTYISYVIGRHHDKREGYQGASKKLHPMLENIWGEKQKEIIKEIEKVIDIDGVVIKGIHNYDVVFTLIWGLIILSDWLASSFYFYGYTKGEKDLGAFADKIRKRAIEVIEDVGLNFGDFLEEDIRYEDILDVLTEENLRPLQKGVIELFEKDKNIRFMIIEAPMGEGKTESAFYAASRMAESKKGLYFALPTSATSNQMYKRVNAFLEKRGKNKSNLIHSTSWLVNSLETVEDDSKEVSAFLKCSRKGLLATTAVGTVDQVMMSVLPVRFSVLRLLGMVGKVVVIDEAHAYDVYMSSIIDTVLSWCKALDIPVIILSATLPKKRKVELLKAYTGLENIEIESNSYPLITTVSKSNLLEENVINGTYIRKELEIESLDILGNAEKIADLSLKVKEQGGCIAYVMNTVGEAQELYKEIKSRYTRDTDIDIILFHARFPAIERERIEKIIVKKFGSDLDSRPKKAIVIATQVLEQSLDIDFDWIISAEAPIDLLLQRMGRQQRFSIENRNSSYSCEKFTVLFKENEKYLLTSYIYQAIITNITQSILVKTPKIILPKDIRVLIDKVYDNPELTEANLEQWYSMMIEGSILDTKAKTSTIGKPKEDEFTLYNRPFLVLDEENARDKYLVAKTRIGEPSSKVVFLPEKEFKALNFNNISREIAISLLEKTINIVDKNIVRENKEGFLPPLEGEGLLKGVVIYPTKGGIYLVGDKRIHGYILDKETGLEIAYNRKRGE